MQHADVEVNGATWGGETSDIKTSKVHGHLKMKQNYFMNFMRFCSLCSLCCRLEHDLNSRAQQNSEKNQQKFLVSVSDEIVRDMFEFLLSFFAPQLQGSVLNWFWLKKIMQSRTSTERGCAPNEMNSQLSTSLLVVITIFVLSHLTLTRATLLSLNASFLSRRPENKNKGSETEGNEVKQHRNNPSLHNLTTKQSHIKHEILISALSFFFARDLLRSTSLKCNVEHKIA